LIVIKTLSRLDGGSCHPLNAQHGVCCSATAGASPAALAAATAAADLPVAAGTYLFKDGPLPAKAKLRNMLILAAVCIVIVVPAVVG
jgi:hypothetical protein